MGQMIVEDIVSCWWQILLGLVASMLVCLIFIAIMRWLAAPTIWFSIIGVIAMLSYGKYLRFFNKGVNSEHFEAETLNSSSFCYTRRRKCQY